MIFKRRFTQGFSYQLSYTLSQQSKDTRSMDPTKRHLVEVQNKRQEALRLITIIGV